MMNCGCHESLYAFIADFEEQAIEDTAFIIATIASNGRVHFEDKTSIKSTDLLLYFVDDDFVAEYPCRALEMAEQLLASACNRLFNT